jgi:hypothetical protein
MVKRVASIAFIYACIAVAWMVLGVSMTHRSFDTNQRLEREVAGLWGSPQLQVSPELRFEWKDSVTVEETVTDPSSGKQTKVSRQREVVREQAEILDGSEIVVDLQLDQRKKGLLWYSTYLVDFQALYDYTHDEERAGELIVTYCFPIRKTTYDDFRFVVDGKPDPDLAPTEVDGARVVQQRVPVTPGQRISFVVGYRSRGLDWWRYSFGSNVNRAKNFKLAMTTDFAEIDYPQGTISPAELRRTGDGWTLVWESENIISGFQIGMVMPQRLNPGPLAARISFFAPVSLFFFFVWIFVITLFRGTSLHPINYLFLGCAFFAFHLLLAYTVDHIALVPAFLIASGVSVFLVVSYLRLVVGLRFAALEAGSSQLIYLVLFSYAHFFEGLTGLVVTIGSILTLFALMQLTGRLDWGEQFRRLDAAPPELPAS